MAIFVHLQGDDLQAAEPCRVIGRHAVVVEKIPLAFILHDTVMGGPADHRLQDDTLIGERTIGVVAHSIAQIVRVAGAIGEIILAILLVHP